ncbi:MAG: epoxyqueuosine reductase [Desulfobulbaceae bacterium]|nr:epoxyqueuosine reductase [Desulfobulbaceae bacterium]
MKKRTIQKIEDFVAEYQQKKDISTSWGVPLLGFAAADDPLFEQLKTAVSSTHAVPKDLLRNAGTVVSFFLPFPKSVTSTNTKERLSSHEWAVSYVETNELIKQLSLHLTELFTAANEKVVSIPATHNWIEDKLISNWSHRHVAFIAGLGQFGLNNMLITNKGCCGRVGSLITSAVIEPDARPEVEACLYKYDGSCKKCVRKCVNDALFEDSFDRFKCYDQLLENVEEHKAVGYADVCGKCLAAVPCSHINPVKVKLKKK